MVQDIIHQKILKFRSSIDSWFRQKSAGLSFPFYSSFDIRDSGIIVAPVDANIFPAGFNNICQVDQESAVDITRKYIEIHYGTDVKSIALLAEEHTNNLYYWNNVGALLSLLTKSGYETKVAIPKELPQPLTVTSAAGITLEVFGAIVDQGLVKIDGSSVDLIICNNDFSQSYETWIEGLKTPMNPPHTLGWHRRRKSDFFKLYNQLAFEFAELIDINPISIQVQTQLFTHFDVTSEDSRDQLAQEVDRFLIHLKKEYEDKGITQEPFAFVKNNSGTYGMAVTQVKSGDEIRNWNYKFRKKMKTGKGGNTVGELIIQEGIPTRIVTEEETAEPTIYMIGCHLAGGFLRAHSKKGPDESLNSPGAVFKRLCVSDLKISLEGAPLENVYGWLARLGFLAIAQEAKQAKVEFVGYRAGCSL